jgi:hypothetical protein
MLKITDLVVGEYYTITDNAYENKRIIHQYVKMSDDVRSYGPYITDFDGTWKFTENTPYLKGRNITKSTPEEKKWLDACIKQKRFVTFEEAMKEDNKFIGGQYYVVLKKPNGNQNFIKENHVYKQYVTDSLFYVEKDSYGILCSCDDITIKDKSTWRLATPEEIELYEANDGPVKLTKRKY